MAITGVEIGSMTIIRRLRSFLADEDWTFAPHELPVMPGSPGSPAHPMSRRVANGLIAILVGLTGGFGNALIAALRAS